jgi:glycosyltransferase involved in cell wall biosynthesis
MSGGGRPGLRVVHILHSLARAGAEAHVRNLASAAHPKIAAQTVIAWKASGPLAADFQALGVELHAPEQPLSGGAGLWRLLGLVRRIKPDVMHAHMSDAIILAALVSRLTGAPFIATHQDGTRLVPDMPAIRKAVRRGALIWSAQRASAHVAVVPDLANRVRDELGLPPERVRFIPNCIPVPTDADIAQAARAREALRAQGQARIVALGRYVPLKAFDQLIDAAALMAERDSGWRRRLRIEIFGSGPLEADLQARVAQRGVADMVAVAGPTANPAQALATATHYVSTSEYEGMSLALLEAMAWRLPILVSDVPGNRETIRFGRTGLSYMYRDLQSLADGLAKLITQAALADELAEAARAEAVARYGAAAILSQHVELYGKAAGLAALQH